MGWRWHYYPNGARGVLTDYTVDCVSICHICFSGFEFGVVGSAAIRLSLAIVQTWSMQFRLAMSIRPS